MKKMNKTLKKMGLYSGLVALVLNFGGCSMTPTVQYNNNGMGVGAQVEFGGPSVRYRPAYKLGETLPAESAPVVKEKGHFAKNWPYYLLGAVATGFVAERYATDHWNWPFKDKDDTHHVHPGGYNPNQGTDQGPGDDGDQDTFAPLPTGSDTSLDTGNW
jgi:hypothetical protein